MRAGINGLSASFGGGRTYLANILPQLDSHHTGIDWCVYVGSQRPQWLEQLITHCGSVEWRKLNWVPQSAWGRGLYEQTVLPRLVAKDRLDVLWSPAEILPLASHVSHILTLQNANLYSSLSLDWTGADRARLAVLRRLSKWSVARASRIVFVSEDSRRWISEKLEIPSSKSVAIPHGVGEQFRAHTMPELPAVLAARLTGAPYILSVSTVYRYKNFLTLVEAFDHAMRISDIPHHLVIVGQQVDREYSMRLKAKVDESPNRHRIHLIGGIEYDEMPSVYQRAALKVFPSYLETFGLPLLEAMAAGVPVLASDIGVFREVGGDAVLYFDYQAAIDLASKIVRVIHDEQLRARMSNAGKVRSALFTWEQAAESLAEVVESLATSRSG